MMIHLAMFAQNQKWKHQSNVWNLFKINSKDTRTRHTKGLQLFIKKETLAKVFSCEFYKISKNTFL